MSTEVPTAQKSTDANGDRVYTWEDGARVECALSKMNSKRQYPVTVYYNGAVVGYGGEVNLQNLAERKRLHAHCRHADGAVNWLPKLTEVAQDLGTLDIGVEKARHLRVTSLA